MADRAEAAEVEPPVTNTQIADATIAASHSIRANLRRLGALDTAATPTGATVLISRLAHPPATSTCASRADRMSAELVRVRNPSRLRQSVPMYGNVPPPRLASIKRCPLLPRLLGIVRPSHRGERQFSNLRVGIDLVDIREVHATLQSPLRNRYLERIYTTSEIEACRTGTNVDAGKLAARFAAKEATMKALRVGDRAVSWRNIEVRRDCDGAPRLVLHDAAAALARGASVNQLHVSLSHEHGYAAAMVVAA